jgi:hypothetical protein
VTKPLIFPVADIRPDMHVKYMLDNEHFGTAVVTDFYTEPLGFILYDRYNGYPEVEAPAIFAVLWDDECDQPMTKWTGGPVSGWVQVAQRPANWDDMGSSERDLWEERTARLSGAAR